MKVLSTTLFWSMFWNLFLIRILTLVLNPYFKYMIWRLILHLRMCWFWICLMWIFILFHYFFSKCSYFFERADLQIVLIAVWIHACCFFYSYWIYSETDYNCCNVCPLGVLVCPECHTVGEWCIIRYPIAVIIFCFRCRGCMVEDDDNKYP